MILNHDECLRSFFFGARFVHQRLYHFSLQVKKNTSKFQQIHPLPFIIPKNNTAVTIGNQWKHIETICLAKTERWQCYTNTIGQIIVNYKQQVVSDPKLNKAYNDMKKPHKLLTLFQTSTILLNKYMSHMIPSTSSTSFILSY